MNNNDNHNYVRTMDASVVFVWHCILYCIKYHSLNVLFDSKEK